MIRTLYLARANATLVDAEGKRSYVITLRLRRNVIIT